MSSANERARRIWRKIKQLETGSKSGRTASYSNDANLEKEKQCCLCNHYLRIFFANSSQFGLQTRVVCPGDSQKSEARLRHERPVSFEEARTGDDRGSHGQRRYAKICNFERGISRVTTASTPTAAGKCFVSVWTLPIHPRRRTRKKREVERSRRSTDGRVFAKG